MAEINPLAEVLGYFLRKNRSPEKKAELTNKLAIQLANLLRQKGISCHCGGLAVPVEGRGKIYRCVKCDKQFANATYDLRRYESYKPSVYFEAVNILKSQ